ncbi:MAG: ABC transporter ATP-binding protein [Anaerolineales bacterium]|nr:ABC transporter ATP-binding protein [Chloroflexota bacterium]MBL6980217.1 ABC transporter ATP-binding protein [Anaerolineales bacterium]
MSDLAISIQNISKVYRIDPTTGGAASRTLQEDLVNFAKNPLRRTTSSKKQEIWALNDVSFDVHEGEVIGLIGRNGAGKSTLLKILSRITEPTHGFADIFGRVGSLLEVGTGFHTELTGRENIYLSGAILGMRKAEIDRKFDQIVEFSGVSKFIETPVKRYSSGMAVRLAFAVAAHLDPEILLVDEVLAVGDASFQKKSLGKMSEVAESGRTVIFVSHNMGAIKNLCTRAVLLDGGKALVDGDVDHVVQEYLITASEKGEWHTEIADREDRQGSGALRFTGFQLRGSNGSTVEAAVAGEAVEFVLQFQCNSEKIQNASIMIWLRDAFTKGLLRLGTELTAQSFNELPQEGKIICRVPRFSLRPGRYFIDLGADIDGVKADRVIRAVTLDVVGGDFYGSGKVPLHPNDGDLLCEHSWRLG